MYLLVHYIVQMSISSS